MTLRLVSTHNATYRAELEAVYGLAFGRAIIAPLGSNWQAAHVKKQLADCRAKGQTAFVWATLQETIDDVPSLLPTLPASQQVAELVALLDEHAALCVVHLLSEGWRWIKVGVTGAQFTTAFNGIAMQLPPNAIPEVSIAPGTIVNKIPAWAFPEWWPSLAQIGALDLFGVNVTPNTKQYDAGIQFADFAHAQGAIVGIGESGFVGPGDVQDPAVIKPWLGALLKMASKIDAEYLTILNDAWGGYPGWESGRFTAALPGGDGWPGCPEAVTMFGAKLKKGGVIMAPVPMLPLPDTITPVGPVTAVD